MIVPSLFVGLFVASALSQGRVRFAVAGKALPAALVASSMLLPFGVGEATTGAVFAVATALAWLGVIPAPPATQVANALGSGVAVALTLLVARLAASVNPALGAMTFAALFFAVEVAGSRSNPFGEWGALAHSQTREQWALAVARPGPHAVTLTLVLISGSIGYAAATHSLSPLALAVLGAVHVAIAFGRWRRSMRSPGVKSVRAVGLIESDEDVFAETVGAFVNGTMTASDWTAFDLQSAASLDALLADTAEAAAHGAELVVWAEGAGLVNAENHSAALARAQAITVDAACVLVASWLVLCRADGLMANITTCIDNGNVKSTVGKQHPVPGAEADRTRLVPSDTHVVDTSFGRLGVAICFDADHHRTWAQLGRDNVDVVAIPASDWPAIGGLHADMARLRSQSIGAAIIRPARAGMSIITDTQGRVRQNVDHRQTNQSAVSINLPLMIPSARPVLDERNQLPSSK